MVHACIVLLFSTFAFWGNFPSWMPLLAAAFFLGREHAQAEYRWIDAYGGGQRANMPWWGGFDPRAWTFKGLMDWLLPLLVAVSYWGLAASI